MASVHISSLGILMGELFTGESLNSLDLMQRILQEGLSGQFHKGPAVAAL